MKYEARIRQQENSFYALIVRVEEDGFEFVSNGYKGRFFASRKAAEKSTSNYLSKFCA